MPKFAGLSVQEWSIRRLGHKMFLLLALQSDPSALFKPLERNNHMLKQFVYDHLAGILTL